MKEPNPNQEALNLQKQINCLKEKESKLYVERIHLTRQMELLCIHNETEKQHDYIPGGYLDREQFINKVVCKICGKVITEEITTGYFQ
jgi:hypothetical protein